jgi:hypothetical protein
VHPLNDVVMHPCAITAIHSPVRARYGCYLSDPFIQCEWLCRNCQ